ncbi:MAG: Ankyrin repeats (3 copies) [Candidatus Dependentiae bacterium ADurb.Bin331]|nr:MAG: Ankyrin repeats (3 copies) [Candidatus Dependentiae bacterium ADurb.Bin331]
MSKELHHLFNAIRTDHLNQVEVAIKDNQSLINTKDDKGNTSLIIAAEHGNTGIVNTLVKHGAHLNYQTPEKKQTALMIAVQFGNIDTAKYLVENGADITLVDSQKKTALDYAQQQQNQLLIKILQS